MKSSYIQFAWNLEKIPVIGKAIALIYRFRRILSVANEGTYYPENQRKRKNERIWDLIKWSWCYGEVNESYNVFVEDMKKKSESKKERNAKKRDRGTRRGAARA